MRKALLTAVATFVVIGAGVLAVRHYNQYQNLQNNTEQAAAEAEANALAEAEKKHSADREAWVAEQNELRVECEKGKAAWDELTSFQRRAIEEPVCGLVVQ